MAKSTQLAILTQSHLILSPVGACIFWIKVCCILYLLLDANCAHQSGPCLSHLIGPTKWVLRRVLSRNVDKAA